MAGFNAGRRALYPNLANLNAIPSDPSDYNMVLQRENDGYQLEQELAMFTNTQFFDFDQNLSPESQFDGASSGNQPANVGLLSDEFEIPDLGIHNNVAQTAQTAQTTQPAAAQQQQPGHFQFQAQPFAQSNPSSSSQSPSQPGLGEKRKLENTLDVSSPLLDDNSRVAAEEDKRRRNTAASARFRAKKKQREEAMEKTAKEMTDKVSQLESRIAKLDMENKLLKDLITERSGKEVDLADLYRKVSKPGKEPAKRADKLAREAQLKPEHEAEPADAIMAIR